MRAEDYEYIHNYLVGALVAKTCVRCRKPLSDNCKCETRTVRQLLNRRSNQWFVFTPDMSNADRVAHKWLNDQRWWACREGKSPQELERLTVIADLVRRSLRDGSNGKEYVAVAAVKAIDGTIYALPRPSRHCHVMWEMTEGEDDEQGFLSSTGRWLSRTEAAIVARDSGRIDYWRDGLELYSEDLW